MSEFLSQDEVDSLLKGVTGEVDEVAKPEEEGYGMHSYNLASQERIVRGRMPTMEIVNERFARHFRIGLFNFMRRSADVTVGALRVQKFSEFTRNLPVPANFNIVQAKPLRGNALLVFDPNLIFLIVDNMFGGDGRFHVRVEGREFTQTEQRIIGKMINVAFDALEKAWETVFKMQFEYVRSEMNPQFANIATPNEVVVTSTFDVEFGEKGGAVNLCIPYSMIEPLREQLYSTMQGDHVAVDRRWQQMLARQVQAADIELTAILGRANVTLDHILKMKVGDVIPIETGENITAQVDGVPVMECKYGVFNSQYALKVEKLLASQPSDITEGGNNG